MPLEDAKAIFGALTADTAFDPQDRERSFSVLLSAMLAMFCDCMFDRFTIRPAFINEGNAPGCGKTLAAQMAIAPVFGPTRLTAPPSADNSDKWSELVSSIAQSGVHYVVFDNARGRIENSALESLITAPTISGRVLGSSQMFEVERSCIVFITVNHAIIGEDMLRRALVCRFYIPEARPEDHRFARPMCEADILAMRHEILAALWALVGNWRDCRCEPGKVWHGSFDTWGRVVGGILEEAGYVSPLRQPPDLLNDRLSNMSKLVTAAAAQMLGDELWLKPAELLELAREAGCFSWFINADRPDEDKPDGRKDLRKESQQLGVQCGFYRRGRVFTLNDGQQIRFNVIGDGHTRKYGFERIT